MYIEQINSPEDLKKLTKNQLDLLAKEMRDTFYDSSERYPTGIIEISTANQHGKVHPTQKPVELMEYLIKTYTNEGELVLDFTMGSGSTGVACANTNRKFIGIELDENKIDQLRRA